MDEIKDQVSFGFETVSAREKVQRVKGVFGSVAPQYDIMNDLMSAGIHRLWKADMMARINPQPGEQLLDIAGGTGDVALSFLRRAASVAKRRTTAYPAAKAVICDINSAMLMAGRARRDMQDWQADLSWVCGDAESLPFADNSADIVTIAFGIRNVAYRLKALSEFKRVLKPGGRLAILEFSHMTASGLQTLYDRYSFSVIPALGGLIAKDKASYQYLVESIRRFPKQGAFAEELEAAGFAHIQVTNFTGGVAALHQARAL